jgi:protein TonB
MKGAIRLIKGSFHVALVVAGALALTVAFFLVLPLMQTIASRSDTDLRVQTVDVADVPPPPPPPEEPPPEEEPPEEPPELMEEAPPLDLSQLELALDPGFNEGWMTGDFAVKLNAAASGDGEVDALFSMADLDQKPRVIYQPSPTLNAKMRKKAPGKVTVIFVVDERGRVENPIVRQSSDPIFERAALAAVKQWKFEPGKRNGRPVQFRMLVPVIFPKG